MESNELKNQAIKNLPKVKVNNFVEIKEKNKLLVSQNKK